MAKILILIPAYNESSAIPDVIAGIRNVVPDCDVVVVDDGSSDQTASAAMAAGARVIRHPFNMGYGVAVQTGYKFALAYDYDYVVQVDGDGQHDVSCITDVLAPLLEGKADFVLGSRFLDVQSYSPPLARRLGMAFFRGIVSSIIRQRVSDCTSGYQAFNRNVIAFFCRDAFPCDYPDADVLISLHLAGFRIGEVPVRMFSRSDGKSMHSGLKPVYYIFKMLLSIFITLIRRTNYSS